MCAMTDDGRRATSALTRTRRRALPSDLRRAMARADAGKTLDVDEAATLLGARGDALSELLATAARIRDGAHGERITYSRKVFIPLTHLCRDSCGYCTFAWPPKGDMPAFLSPEQVLEIARAGQAAGCKEALFTLGDKPEERYPAARAWLDARGYDTTLAYLRAVSIQVVEETGLIPHLNPGVMSWSDLATLKQVSGSMGIMLESASRRLLAKGEAHFGAPDKDPALRLRTIEDAGRLSIPFTSGILIGIGETHRERVEALLALRDSARRYGHLQEVIVQNFRAKPDTAMRDHPEPDTEELLATIAVARVLLPTRVHLQAPPNLSPHDVERIVAAGVDDWGGVSPVTPDHVNPEYAWPHLDDLTARTAAAGKVLAERLCAYPEYVRRPDPWLAGRMRAPVLALADPDGMARPDAEPEGHPWQDPAEVAVPSTGDDSRWHDARAGDGVATLRRDEAFRADAEAVYGDSALIAAETLTRRAPQARRATAGGAARSHLRPEISAILRRAERGRAPSEAEALTLFSTEGAEVEALAATADAVRAERVGDVVTYVVNRNVNFTNVCYTGCRFCAFAQRRDDPDAYSLSLDQVADRVEEAWAWGATEVCMQGGIHPDLGGETYFDLVRAVKARVPGIHVHAFSPMEVVNGASRLGISIREFLTECRDAGLGSIPGTAAEILDDDVRWVLTKGKLPADAWIDVVTTAHDIGLPSTSTMMFGHVDEPRHWAAHLHLLRALQESSAATRPAGFTEFVPLPFIHTQAPIYLAGLARPGPTWDETLKVHAIARLVLQGAIDHVQLSWVKVGLEGAVQLLQAGCDDLGGTLMEETISRMAGADHGVRQDPEDLRAVAEQAGRIPAERTTDYAHFAPGGIRYTSFVPSDPGGTPAAVGQS
jgi:FO synthase